jgi:Putative beta barrel porin-7 (BBP7)
MRTKLLGSMALLLGAVSFLGGADGARAQSSSGYGANGYPSAYNSAYQGTSPVSFRNYNYVTAGQSGWYSPYYYYPGYGYYPNYSNYNQYYNQYYNQGYQGSYPDQYTQGSDPSAASSGPAQPVVPLTPEEIPGDETPAQPALASAPSAHDRFWLSAGYELSYIKPWKLTTPLVTTSQPTAPAPQGALGQPSTGILFGDRVDFGRFDGLRLGAGLFLDDCDKFSVEGIGMVQIPGHVHYGAASDANGNPLIARPIFDVLSGAQASLSDSFAGRSAGSISVDSRSQLLGAELNARYDCRPTDHFHVDALVGFRFLRLAETLTIRDEVTALSDGVLTFNGSPISAGQMLTDVDNFHTVNHFYGLQLGTGFNWEGKWIYAGAYGKIAVGVTDQEVDITGSTTYLNPLGTQVAGGGVLALPSNMGQHTRDALGWMPEGGINFGVKVKPCLRLTAGYSFLYWNAVVRPGAQINPAVNSAAISSSQFFGSPGGPPQPQFRFNDETYWVHTLTFGVDFRY